MQAFKRLVTDISNSFPDYSLHAGAFFKWSPTRQEISYIPPKDFRRYDLTETVAQSALLHELGHAVLHHKTYLYDIQLLQQEVAAWDCAVDSLGPRYNTELDQNYIYDCLETYRGWLYQRSLCPRCRVTGIQQQTSNYSCINCSYLWRANDARACGLRRLKLLDQNQSVEP